MLQMKKVKLRETKPVSGSFPVPPAIVSYHCALRPPLGRKGAPLGDRKTNSRKDESVGRKKGHREGKREKRRE